MEAESLLMHFFFFWVPILSSIKQTQLIICSINSPIRDYLEKRPSELAITYNVTGNYMAFFKALLFLPVSRCQKHPDAGEVASIESETHLGGMGNY